MFPESRELKLRNIPKLVGFIDSSNCGLSEYSCQWMVRSKKSICLQLALSVILILELSVLKY